MEKANFKAITIDEPGWLRIRRESASYSKVDVADRRLASESVLPEARAMP